LDAFSDSDERLLTILARQLATSFQKVRLYSETQQRASQLAEALARLQELDHLKNEFIQNVSHELRTPLAIVLGYTELFDSGDLGDLELQQRGPISIMARRLRTLSKLLNDMLTILESEANNQARKPIDFSQLVFSLLAEVKGSVAQAGLHLESEIAPELPLVEGVITHIQRAVENLLENAIKFTSAGGTVGVRLWRQSQEVILEVSDNGIGIPADQLGRVFERFYQVDGSTTRRYSGTGLGLALVKEVAEAHDGHVSVASVLGQGSAFQIYLPIYKGV
jgi:signal transduction histidine kinase